MDLEATKSHDGPSFARLSHAAICGRSRTRPFRSKFSLGVLELADRRRRRLRDAAYLKPMVDSLKRLREERLALKRHRRRMAKRARRRARINLILGMGGFWENMPNPAPTRIDFSNAIDIVRQIVDETPDCGPSWIALVSVLIHTVYPGLLRREDGPMWFRQLCQAFNRMYRRGHVALGLPEVITRSFMEGRLVPVQYVPSRTFDDLIEDPSPFNRMLAACVVMGHCYEERMVLSEAQPYVQWMKYALNPHQYSDDCTSVVVIGRSGTRLLPIFNIWAPNFTPQGEDMDVDPPLSELQPFDFLPHWPMANGN